MAWGTIIIAGGLVLLAVAALGVRRYGQRHARLTRERMDGRHLAEAVWRDRHQDGV